MLSEKVLPLNGSQKQVKGVCVCVYVSQ